uniref:Putative secreted protein n=1 Tax=Amblyomma triste TaxID=251400 RepID=A0A023G0Y2_AMBTT
MHSLIACLAVFMPLTVLSSDKEWGSCKRDGIKYSNGYQEVIGDPCSSVTCVNGSWVEETCYGYSKRAPKCLPRLKDPEDIDRFPNCCCRVPFCPDKKTEELEEELTKCRDDLKVAKQSGGVEESEHQNTKETN